MKVRRLIYLLYRPNDQGWYFSESAKQSTWVFRMWTRNDDGGGGDDEDHNDHDDDVMMMIMTMMKLMMWW